MATPSLGAESALANPLNIFATFDRSTIAKTVEVLVCVLDAIDGDADALDTNDAEDDFAFTEMAKAAADEGPGCIASDHGDISTTEWHTRGRHKDNPGVRNEHGGALHEDDEDDDPAEDDDPSGQCDEDGVNTGNMVGLFGSGPGCEISDPGGYDEDGL